MGWLVPVRSSKSPWQVPEDKTMDVSLIVTRDAEAVRQEPVEEAGRRIRRHATLTEEDIAIFVAIRDVRPFVADRGDKLRRWQDVAARANVALDVTDITVEMCRRRYELLIARVARCNTLPEAGTAPLDAKLFTVVMAVVVDLKRHYRELEAMRLRQNQEFRYLVLGETRASAASSASVAESSEATSTRGSEAATDGAEAPPSTQTPIKTKRKKPSYATADQLKKMRKLSAMNLTACRQQVNARVDQLKASAEVSLRQQHEKQAALREDVTALRSELVDTQTQHDQQIQRLLVESQAREVEVQALRDAVANERTQRLRLEEELARKEQDFEIHRVAQSSETALMLKTVDELKVFVQQQQRVMRELKRLV